MKLEDIKCTNLELSKELKEAGYPQEGLWWWCKYSKNEWGINHRLVGFNNIVAPTVAELICVLTKLRKGDIIIPDTVSNVANYLAQEVLNEKGKV